MVCERIFAVCVVIRCLNGYMCYDNTSEREIVGFLNTTIRLMFRISYSSIVERVPLCCHFVVLLNFWFVYAICITLLFLRNLFSFLRLPKFVISSVGHSDNSLFFDIRLIKKMNAAQDISGIPNDLNNLPNQPSNTQNYWLTQVSRALHDLAIQIQGNAVSIGVRGEM